MTSLAWGDYDNDGDLDLAVSGDSGSMNGASRLTKLFRNDNGTFNDSGTSLDIVYYGTLSWGDYDSDGLLDLASIGMYANATSGSVKIYHNNGGVLGDSGNSLSALMNSTLSWGDYDNDGDLDLVLAGDNGTIMKTILYRNDTGAFNLADDSLPGTRYASLCWGDYDNDSDPDLMVMGQIPPLSSTAGYMKIVKFVAPELYNTPNTAPQRPSSGFGVTSSTTSVNLRWGYGSDTETGQKGLNYEVQVATNAITGSLRKWVISPSTGASASPFLGNYTHGYCVAERSNSFKVTGVEPKIFSPDEASSAISRTRIYVGES